MTIFINPGSGPVEGSTRADADVNLQAFIADLRAMGKSVTEYRFKSMGDGDGRIVYEIGVDGHFYEIEMPGIPLDRVRYMGEEGQNIWDFPLLYVDGSSWVWEFALNVCEQDEDAS